MSLAANFGEWCRVRGYRPKNAVYLDSSLSGLGENEARVVRMVPPSERAGGNTPQRYVVEAFWNDEFHYPFGATPMSGKELKAAMIRATMERNG